MQEERYVGIAIPFTVEEIETLTAVAAAQGGSLVDLIRARVFGPQDDFLDSVSDAEDLTAMIARLEGFRIRRRPRG